MEIILYPGASVFPFLFEVFIPVLRQRTLEACGTDISRPYERTFIGIFDRLHELFRIQIKDAYGGRIPKVRALCRL